MRKVLFVLGQLSDDDVEWLAKAGQRDRVMPGTVLITEGCQIDSVYILLDGSMSVSVKGIGTVATLSSGEIMGEISMIDSRAPSASITADRECLVLTLPRAALNARLTSDIGFAARFYKAIATFLSDRLRGTVMLMGNKCDISGIGNEDEMEGELDLNVLGNIHLAGARFERLLNKLIG